MVFGSEMKAVLIHPKVERKLNYNTLNAYLTFDYVPVPETIIEGVQQVKGSHYVEFRSGVVSDSGRYWHPDFNKVNISYESAQTRLDSLLDAAVQRRMMSDVPLGVFLSGGLDSSSVAYYLKSSPV